MVSEEEYKQKFMQPIPTIEETIRQFIVDEAKRRYPVKESPIAALAGMETYMKGN